MGSLGVSPNPMTGVLITRGSLDTDIEAECHMDIKNGLYKPKSEATEKNHSCRQLDLGLPNYEERNSYCLSHSVCGTLFD